MSQRLLIAFVLLLAAPTGALAQDDLAAAEAAYLEVDFEATRDLAIRALRAGGHTPEEVVRIYKLLGIASSALDEEEAARDYFVRMLGLDADATLDDSVSPRMRNPYLEARGVWAARQGRLGVEAGLDRGSSAVHVELTDPTDMARRVRVAARLEGASDYTTEVYAAQSVLNAPVAGADTADRVEYYVEVLDMHGNTILSAGSAFEPEVVGRTSFANGEGGGGGGGSVVEEAWFWIVIGAVVAAGAGIAIGFVLDSRSRIGVQTGVSIGVDF